ncbi:queuosine biosynthesis protein [Salmonella phage SSBI34]|nr:queuosine biosynthesis protein [Salmonella phage SSBI34]
MCNCDSCKLSRRVTELREYLVRTGAASVAHVETLDTLYSEYVHDGIDHEWLQAVVDNKWPTSEQHMLKMGWVRIKEEE